MLRCGHDRPRADEGQRVYPRNLTPLASRRRFTRRRGSARAALPGKPSAVASLAPPAAKAEEITLETAAVEDAQWLGQVRAPRDELAKLDAEHAQATEATKSEPVRAGQGAELARHEPAAGTLMIKTPIAPGSVDLPPAWRCHRAGLGRVRLENRRRISAEFVNRSIDGSVFAEAPPSGRCARLPIQIIVYRSGSPGPLVSSRQKPLQAQTGQQNVRRNGERIVTTV